MTLRRMSTGGTVLQEERTVADNIARHGARLLTAFSTLSVNGLLWVQEVGGDFQTWSAVRHVSTGPDDVRRIGIEFLNHTAPDRLVTLGAIDADATRATLSPSPAEAPLPAPREERRQDSRYDISVEVLLRGLGPEHAVLWEERTVADNFGHGGARVKTAMRGLAVGDQVLLQEVSGDFHARGTVRSVFAGEDGIRRVSLAFLDGSPPARLVPSGVPPSRTRRPPATSGTPARGGPPAAESATEPGALGAQVPRAQAVEALEGRATRPSGATPSRDVEVERPAPVDEVREAERAHREGERLLAEEKYWDAIQTLERALRFAQGTEINRSLRLLLAQAVAKNPAWVRRAQGLLLGVLEEDPRQVEAYVALGVIYRSARMLSRARKMLSMALQIDPNHPRALAELRALESESQ